MTMMMTMTEVMLSEQINKNPESSAQDLSLFQQESSFLLHTKPYFSGYYALESVNFPDHYIRVQDDGNLWLEPDAYTTAYIDDASFTIYKYDTSRKYVASPATFSVVYDDPFLYLR